jgi:hypothetical protein
MNYSYVSVAIVSVFKVSVASCIVPQTGDLILFPWQLVGDAENSNMSDTVDFTQACDPINLAGVWEALQNVCFLETFISIVFHSTKPFLITFLPEVIASLSELNIQHYLLLSFEVQYLLGWVSKIYLFC